MSDLDHLNAMYRQAVLDAVGRGDIPTGGPSELAARDLLDRAPAGYLERWAVDAAARIRAQPMPCSCADGGSGGERCGRCYGEATT